MGVEQVTGLIGLVLIMVGGLWAVYNVLAHRIEAVKEHYVRRDDFLRVLDRLEKKLDQHLALITRDRPP